MSPRGVVIGTWGALHANYQAGRLLVSSGTCASSTSRGPPTSTTCATILSRSATASRDCARAGRVRRAVGATVYDTTSALNFEFIDDPAIDETHACAWVAGATGLLSRGVGQSTHVGTDFTLLGCSAMLYLPRVRRSPFRRWRRLQLRLEVQKAQRSCLYDTHEHDLRVLPPSPSSIDTATSTPTCRPAPSRPPPTPQSTSASTSRSRS